MDDETKHEFDELEAPSFELSEAELNEERDALDAIGRRNRMRILIPLVLFIVLWAILGLFGDPIKPAANPSAPVGTPNAP